MSSLYDFILEDDLPHWDVELKELRGNQKTKAKKFVELGKVWRSAPGLWKVYPIEGYNHTTYTVTYNGSEWECNCQFNQTTGRKCSHIYAVMLYELHARGGKHEG